MTTLTTSSRFGTFRQGSDYEQATARVHQWVCDRFQLANDAVVMVSEVSCQVPGCPPIETAIVIWTDDDTCYRTKIFKPVAEVVEDDLPPKWYLPAMYDDGTIWCSCC